MATAYKFYRLVFDANAAADFRYYAVNTLNMYTTPDLSGVDVARSGTATTNGNYTGGSVPTVASNAIDGDDSTYYESSNRVTAGSPGWLQIELTSPQIVRSIRIIPTAFNGERPTAFRLQWSSDGSSWTTVSTFVNFFDGAATSGSAPTLLRVSGVSKLEGGGGTSRVLIHNWTTGVLISSLTPDPVTGAFTFMARDVAPVMVTHIGPSGFRPICDGPITPAEA